MLGERAEQGERLVRLPAPGQRPGDEHGLERRERRLPAEAARAVLRPVPAPLGGVGTEQDELRRRVVRQAAGEAQRLRPAVEQRGEERGVQQVPSLGVAGLGGEEVVGGGAQVARLRGEAADEVGAEGGRDRRRWRGRRGARAVLRRGLGPGGGHAGQQRRANQQQGRKPGGHSVVIPRAAAIAPQFPAAAGPPRRRPSRVGHEGGRRRLGWAHRAARGGGWPACNAAEGEAAAKLTRHLRVTPPPHSL